MAGGGGKGRLPLARPGRCRGTLLLSVPRQLFSQHPYAESFIGKPHVWTIDYNNSEEFEAAIKAIMKTQVRFRPSQGRCQPPPRVPAIVRKRCPSW